MDALAQLALMAKAKRVFEALETFLSFPALSPLSYLPDELRFGNAGEMTPDDLSGFLAGRATLTELTEATPFAGRVP